MEQIITLRAPKKIFVFLASLLILTGLLFLANLEDPVVHFADPNLEQVIREKIGQPSAPIYRTGLLTITELDASDRNIRSLEGIESLRKLVSLNLQDNIIEDLTPLAELEMLSELNLQNNKIIDLEKINFGLLAQLSLRSLNLSQNLEDDGSRLSDISLLRNLTDLEVLNLRNNQIVDIEPLKNLHALQELNLRENRILDISPLGNLPGLISLNIHSNPINKGLDTLSNLKNLQILIMRNVYIGENFGFLEPMTKLKELNIRNTEITDISFIGDLMELGALQDHEEDQNYASINLLEITPTGYGSDPYQNLRPYWDNISNRFPINLPYYQTSVKPPVLSHTSGFYQDDFFLNMSTEDNYSQIYYTLDGTEPIIADQMKVSDSTILYDDPILIKTKINEPNLLSAIETNKWDLYIPEDIVYKATVIRALAIDESGNHSPIVTHTFFVDKEINTKYTFPVLSIVTDADNLFDDEIGIYGLGNYYQNIYDEEPWRNPANYTQRGLKWERPAYFELLSPEGKMLISQNIGIRINGGYSRFYNPRSIRLIASQKYDEQALFNYNFFPAFNSRLQPGVIDSFETLILRNGGNDNEGAMFRDVLAQSLLESTKLDIQGSQPTVVFINGEYWGIYNIRGRYDEQYFQTQYDLASDELIVLTYENGWANVRLGDYRDQGKYYSSLFSLIDQEHDQHNYATMDTLANKNAYQEIAAKIDINNMISYFVSQIYFNNGDWPRNNMFLWNRTIDSADVESDAIYGQDGKWRWMIVDLDFSFGNPMQDNLSRILVELNHDSSTYLFRSLLENEAFKNNFINQTADLLNTIFRENVVLGKVNEYEAMYYPEIEEHIQRWGQPGKSVEGWLSNVESVRNFALLRPSIQRQQVLNYFALPGTTSINLSADPSQGYIRINSIDIQKTTVGVENPNDWTGIYFQDIPVTIIANPQAGYHFVRWEGGEDIITDPTSPDVTLLLQDDLHLYALFEKNEGE